MTTHTFNGQQMTTAEIHKLIPCVRTDKILSHIRAGRNTTAAILNYFPPKPPKPGKGSQFVIGKTPGYERAAPSNMR